MSSTDVVWKNGLIDVDGGGSIVNPRNMWCKEILGYQYRIKMSEPIISLGSRKMNYSFMFGEAAWICSGSNWLDELTPYMKRYADFSDDGVFLNGAYGVKVAEQVAYVADTLSKDQHSRQAIINIWRERPGPSRDIPCTVTMQFLIRNKQLHMLVNMRSQDAVLGFSYDVFTFSAVANLVRTLLFRRDVEIYLGDLYVTVGSFHVYEEHFGKMQEWISDTSQDPRYLEVLRDWQWMSYDMVDTHSYVKQLKGFADDYN